MGIEEYFKHDDDEERFNPVGDLRWTGKDPEPSIDPRCHPDKSPDTTVPQLGSRVLYYDGKKNPFFGTVVAVHEGNKGRSVTIQPDKNGLLTPKNIQRKADQVVVVLT